MPITLRNPFNIRKQSYASSKMMCSKGIGLKSLMTKISEEESDNNNHVLGRSAVKPYPRCIHDDQDYCYLKSCHLCHKNLSVHKDIYMYRGDQGFCSIECRDRQIVMDELEELEASTKQMLKSYRQSSSRHQKSHGSPSAEQPAPSPKKLGFNLIIDSLSILQPLDILLEA